MTYEDVTPNSHRFDINVMPRPRKKNLRFAIKEMALASIRKRGGGKAVFNHMHFL